jgi:hypothetical protein
VAVAQAAQPVAELQALNAARALALDVRNAFVDALLARDSVALARENSAGLRHERASSPAKPTPARLDNACELCQEPCRPRMMPARSFHCKRYTGPAGSPSTT